MEHSELAKFTHQELSAFSHLQLSQNSAKVLASLKESNKPVPPSVVEKLQELCNEADKATKSTKFTDYFKTFSANNKPTGKMLGDIISKISTKVIADKIAGVISDLDFNALKKGFSNFIESIKN